MGCAHRMPCMQLGTDTVMLTGDADFEKISALQLRLIR